MASIAVIEDEPVLLRSVRRALEAAGHDVHGAETAAEGEALVAAQSPDLVLLDLRLPDASGLDVLRRIRESQPELPVVLMTAYSSVADAVEAIRGGASDYLPKPLDLEKLRHLVERLIVEQRRSRELAYHRDRERAVPGGVRTTCPRVHEIFRQIERLAAANLAPGRRPAVLLTGETGTGKGLVARAMHEMLGGGPFIELNCAAMPANLVEAELFGHERGSFTDAKNARAGLFEAAEGGSIFLDEIGHMAIDLQAKFLKVIEDRRVRRLGSTRDRAVDVHVIAATNRDLDEAVAEKAFREDLLHRLRVIAFEIPALRERPEDIVLIARHFAELLGHQYRGRPVRLAEGAERLLARYPWPGNVRELRNVIERAVVLAAGDVLEPTAFEALFRPRAGAEKAAEEWFRLPEGGVRLDEVERDLIRQALERSQGNRTHAAALLGLTRHTLRYRLEKFGLE